MIRSLISTLLVFIAEEASRLIAAAHRARLPDVREPAARAPQAHPAAQRERAARLRPPRQDARERVRAQLAGSLPAVDGVQQRQQQQQQQHVQALQQWRVSGRVRRISSRVRLLLGQQEHGAACRRNQVQLRHRRRFARAQCKYFA